MFIETGDNSFTPAGDGQEGLLPVLHARRDATPQGRQGGRVLAVPAFLASLLIHTCVIAGSILLCRLFPPTLLPGGEFLELSLVSLHTPASGSGSASASSGAQGEMPPAAIPAKTAVESSVAIKPPLSPQKERVPAGAQPQKQARAIRQAHAQPEGPFEEAGDADSGKDAAPAGAAQGSAGGGAGHGGSGNGSQPVPFGGHINPRPAYPELARQRGQEGQVVLLVNVDMRGNPTTVLVEASSEYALLDQAAIQAIRRWKFNPASRNGEAVPGTVRVPVTFRLHQVPQ